MTDEELALRLLAERGRDVARTVEQALKALAPMSASGGGPQIEVRGGWDPDTETWLDYFTLGKSGLGDSGVTLGPG